MSEEIVKTVRCDMCGEVLDLDDEWVVRNSVRASSVALLVAHVHNPRTGISLVSLDLCPACADRAASIHCEVVPDGRACRYEYSWREQR